MDGDASTVACDGEVQKRKNEQLNGASGVTRRVPTYSSLDHGGRSGTVGRFGQVVAAVRWESEQAVGRSGRSVGQVGQASQAGGRAGQSCGRACRGGGGGNTVPSACQVSARLRRECLGVQTVRTSTSTSTHLFSLRAYRHPFSREVLLSTLKPCGRPVRRDEAGAGVCRRDPRPRRHSAGPRRSRPADRCAGADPHLAAAPARGIRSSMRP